jgi:hypothetical protein
LAYLDNMCKFSCLGTRWYASSHFHDHDPASAQTIFSPGSAAGSAG